MGNFKCGSVVTQTRKFSCNSSVNVRMSRISSQKSNDKWQFCRRTQPPDDIADCTKRRACISWPWPILIALASMNLRLANCSMSVVGSEPIDKKQTRGVRGSDSSNMRSKSSITPSMNFSPIESAIYFLAWGKVRSGHHERISKSFLKMSSELL